MKYKTAVIAAASMFMVLSTACVEAGAAVTYQVTKLDFNASDINDDGLIVGSLWQAGSVQLVTYKQGAYSYIGKLGSQFGEVNGVNASGQAVGQWDVAGGYTYSNGVTTKLPNLGGATAPESVNKHGQITGSAAFTTSADPYSDRMHAHAFLYQSGGAMQDLGTLGGTYSSGFGINDAGQVAGSSTTAAGDEHAFLYRDGAMVDLGTLGGKTSAGEQINNAGVIVGWSGLAGDASEPEYTRSHAFAYSAGHLTDLGTLGGSTSYASDINDAGVIVGGSAFSLASPYDTRAFVYMDGQITDLNTLLDDHAPAGLVLSGARRINNQGHIIVDGELNGEYLSFLLTPTASVPEPGTYALALCGLLAIGWAKRRVQHSGEALLRDPA